MKSLIIQKLFLLGISEFPDSIENCSQLVQLDASVNPVDKYVHAVLYIFFRSNLHVTY